jgi:hypothetical protein
MAKWTVFGLLSLALIGNQAVLATGAQEEHCRMDDHSGTVTRGDAAYQKVVDAVRRFDAAADRNGISMPSQFRGAVGAEVVSYHYSVLKCTTGQIQDANQADDSLPSVGDVHQFPGQNAPNGTIMSISTCAMSVSTQIDYVKVENGWAVTKVVSQHVKMCQVGGN